MQYAFITLGDKFTDAKLNDLLAGIGAAGRKITMWENARDKIAQINAASQPNVLLVDVGDNASIGRLNVIINLLTCLTMQPPCIYFLPVCPKLVGGVARQQFPNSILMSFDYRVAKPVPKPVKF